MSAPRPRVPTPDELVAIADVVRQHAAQMTEASERPPGTREQWSAVLCLRDADSYLRSAAVWLARHDELQAGHR